MDQTEIKPLLTPEDHDAGFKEIPLQYRRGSTPKGLPENVKLSAPSRRMAMALSAEVAESFRKLAENSELKTQNSELPDPFLAVTLACLPKDFEPLWLERLTAECAGMIDSIAFELTFGFEAQKKMLAAAQAILALYRTDATGSESKS